MSDQQRKKNPPSSSSSENHPERDWTVSPLTRNKNRGDNCCWTRGSFLLSVQFNHSYSAHVQETERVRTTKCTRALPLNWSWMEWVGKGSHPTTFQLQFHSSSLFSGWQVEWGRGTTGQTDRLRSWGKERWGEGHQFQVNLSWTELEGFADRVSFKCHVHPPCFLPRCFFQLISAFH